MNMQAGCGVDETVGRGVGIGILSQGPMCEETVNRVAWFVRR